MLMPKHKCSLWLCHLVLGGITAAACPVLFLLGIGLWTGNITSSFSVLHARRWLGWQYCSCLACRCLATWHSTPFLLLPRVRDPPDARPISQIGVPDITVYTLPLKDLYASGKNICPLVLKCEWKPSICVCIRLVGFMVASFKAQTCDQFHSRLLYSDNLEQTDLFFGPPHHPSADL